MNIQIVALMVQEGGRLVTELIRNRPKRKLVPPEIHLPEVPEETLREEIAKPSTASDVATGCVPCSIGHLGTCVGVTNEANRFAKKDGIGSGEVINRVNICLDELNALERVDLRPEMIAGLPDWEKALANEALSVSRETRHSLENLSSVDELERVAAKLQTARQGIGKEWFRERLARMPKEEKAKLAERALEKLEE